jgi:uncharacterized cofD-like protein
MIEIFNNQRERFEKENGKEFNLGYGSIGNFFLTGCFYEFEKSLQTAIYLYKQLASVKGEVIPATLENIYLGVELINGDKIWGQSLLSHYEHAPIKSSSLFYFDKESREIVKPQINPMAAKAIEQAELIVYSMGSFYTSIDSPLYLGGTSKAIRESSAPKVFISNPREEYETIGMSVGEMANEIIKVLRENDSQPGEDTDYLQFVIANDHDGTPIFNEKFRYLSGDTSGLNSNIHLLKFPLVKDYKIGNYDPEYLTKILFSFLSPLRSI